MAAVAEATALDRLRSWRPSRRGMALAGLLLVALVALALTSRSRTGYLDPAAVDPQGSRAVATILRDLGVDVREARYASDVVGAAAGATVLLTTPALPTASMVDAVVQAGPRRVVLVQPPPGVPAMDRLAAGIGAGGGAGDEVLEPSCDLPAARRAGPARLPGARYDARSWEGVGVACYDRPDAASVVWLPARGGRPEVVLLGSPNPLTNAGLDEEGNAALALNLLGQGPRLLWWRPTIADPAFDSEDQVPIEQLVPRWVGPVAVQVAVALLLVVWWRGRRFGRLAVEPLPVVVRAGETTAGHARLLHANRARGEAAELLRRQARETIRTRLGLPVGCPAESLVAATSARTGTSSGDVGALLYGRQPERDGQLVELAHALEALVSEVGGA